MWIAPDPPVRQIPINWQRCGFLCAASSRLCLPVLSLCAIHAFPSLRAEPPLIGLSWQQGNCELSWTPQPQSANFLQISDNLLDWRYHSLTLPGGSPMRTLDFPHIPGTSGSRFFRAVASPYLGNDPDSEDFDADGLSTREELLIFGTDPLLRDSDGNGVPDGGGDSDLDGLPDAVEIRAGLDIHNPTDASSDLDHDGIPNLAESSSGTDPANPDTDHDGLGDAWERLHGDPLVFSDPLADADLDGLTSLTEYQLSTLPNLVDSNSDGISDADEDADLDGVSNLQEQTAATNPSDYYNGKSVSIAVIAGDNQTISPGAATTPVTIRVTRYQTTTPYANAPVFVAATCAGAVHGEPHPGVVFRTQADGTCSFTFEAAPEALAGPSPLFLGAGTTSTGPARARVNLEILQSQSPPEPPTPRAPDSGSMPAPPPDSQATPQPAVLPAVLKLADLPVPDNHVPWKVNDRGQVAFLNYNQDGLVLWNGNSLVTVPQAHPGFLLISDLDSSGRLVGNLERLVIENLNFYRSTWAFHADIGAARLSILKPDVPDLYQTWESFAWDGWGPGPQQFSTLNKSTLTHIAENGIAWGVRDGFQIVATASPVENRRNYLTEMWSGIPSGYQTSSGEWSTLPGNSAAFLKFNNDTRAIGPIGAISVPFIISPDASHWLLTVGASSIKVGSAGYSMKSVTQIEARPDIALPARLPTAAVAITDIGELAGSGGFSPYDPYFCKNGTLVRFAAIDQVLGMANRKSGEPAMVLGKKGVWLQRPDPATGLPQDPAAGNNAFEYRTYQDLGGTSLALTNLEALAASKQGNTVILKGTDAQGLARHLTAALLPVEVVPDCNRDGKIDQVDRGKVTVEKPWRFWINDDDDSGDTGGSDISVEDDGGIVPDAVGTSVDGIRDLIDFFPLHLDLKAALTSMSETDFQYFLKHESQTWPPGSAVFAPTFNVIWYPEAVLEGDPVGKTGVGSFLKNLDRATDVASRAVNPIQQAGLRIPNDMLLAAKNNKGVILVEARYATNNPIQIEIRKNDGTIVGHVDFPLNITPVKDMLRYKFVMPGAANLNAGDIPGSPPNWPDADRNDKHFIFVHGYNVNDTQSKGWGGEAFKRLFWSGSNARFTAFGWYGYQGQTFGITPDYQVNLDNAFGTAKSLKQFLDLLEGEKTVAAHSMGNILVGSAMHDWGARPKNYLMLNAAAAKECYDTVEADEPAQDAAMENQIWRGYPKELRASEWHRLLPPAAWPGSDWRGKLTWRGRFANVIQNGGQTDVYNFYSSGEEVLNNPKLDTPLTNNAITEAWLKPNRVWAVQEKRKGHGVTGYIHTSNYGGWRFNLMTAYDAVIHDNTSGNILMKTPAQLPNPLNNAFLLHLASNPFFDRSAHSALYEPETGSNSAGSNYAYNHRNTIISEMIPCTSFAAGRNSITTLGDQNIDMDARMKTDAAHWPLSNVHDLIDNRPRPWLHSDVREKAFTHNWKAYEKFTSLGNFKFNN